MLLVISRRWGAAALIRPQLPSQPASKPTSARFTRTLPASTQLTRALFRALARLTRSVMRRCSRWPRAVRACCTSAASSSRANFGVVIHCRSSFSDEPGTLVKEYDPTMEKAIVSGVAHDLSEAKFTIRDVPDTTGVAAKVFGAMADANLGVDMIIQNLSENGHTDITFTSPKADIEKTTEVMDRIVRELGARELLITDEVAKVSIIGAGMKVNSGVAAQMFRTLAEGGINISMISTSDIPYERRHPGPRAPRRRCACCIRRSVSTAPRSSRRRNFLPKSSPPRPIRAVNRGGAWKSALTSSSRWIKALRSSMTYAPSAPRRRLPTSSA